MPKNWKYGAILLLPLLGVLFFEGVCRVFLMAGEKRILDERGEKDFAGRLHPPDLDRTFDATGLYAGGGKVRFRTSARRLVEPDPGNAPKTARVLFFGGSTTEASALPEEVRWAALLGKEGIAAYNAGVSGSNGLDALYHFRFLREKVRPRLVVLSTLINDITWMRRFDDMGFPYNHEAYFDARIKWLLSEREREIRQNGWGRAEEFSALFHFTRRFTQRLHRSGRNSTPFEQLKALIQEREKEFGGRRVPLASCPVRERELSAFSGAVQSLIGRFIGEIRDSRAALLVLSEPTGFGAPASSFFEDLRPPFHCSEALFSNEDARVYLGEFASRYLEAARAAGAEVFDLAALPEWNGPEGGRFFYDGVHLTPEGSRKVAEILSPVIRKILEDSQVTVPTKD